MGAARKAEIKSLLQQEETLRKRRQELEKQERWETYNHVLKQSNQEDDGV